MILKKTYSTKTYFQYKDNKKQIEKSYNEGKGLLDSAVYKWETDRNYKEIIYDKNNEIVSISSSTLSENYRDQKKEYKTYKNKKIELWEKYENIIDSNNNFTKSIIIDLVTSKKTEICYIYKKFDKYKNITESHAFDCVQNKIIKIRLNAYFYYN